MIIFIVIIVISGLLNAMYYLPIMISAFLKGEKVNKIAGIEKIPVVMMIPIVILGLLILVIGIYPDLIYGLIENAVNAIL
jgi:multicomponent Na+:H+ antiporter subunit D